VAEEPSWPLALWDSTTSDTASTGGDNVERHTPERYAVLCSPGLSANTQSVLQFVVVMAAKEVVAWTAKGPVGPAPAADRIGPRPPVAVSFPFPPSMLSASGSPSMRPGCEADQGRV
jgi:hypothetical protein